MSDSSEFKNCMEKFEVGCQLIATTSLTTNALDQRVRRLQKKTGEMKIMREREREREIERERAQILHEDSYGAI